MNNETKNAWSMVNSDGSTTLWNYLWVDFENALVVYEVLWNFLEFCHENWLPSTGNHYAKENFLMLKFFPITTMRHGKHFQTVAAISVYVCTALCCKFLWVYFSVSQRKIHQLKFIDLLLSTVLIIFKIGSNLCNCWKSRIFLHKH